MTGEAHTALGSQRLWWLAATAVAIAYAWAAYVPRFILLNGGCDTWAHLAYIRRTMEHGWFPGDAFYAGLPTAPYYSLEHIVLAAVSLTTGVAADVVWIHLPPLIALAAFGAEIVWLHALTRDLRVALLGAAIDALVQMPDPTWPASPYPRAVALIPAALAQLWYLRGRQSGRLSLVIAAGGALGVCLATHLFNGGFCLLSLVFLEVALASKPARLSPRLAVTSAIGLVIGSPWIVSTAFAWHAREGLAPELFKLTDGVWMWPLQSITLRVLHPEMILAALPRPLWWPIGIGLLFGVWRWIRGRATPADRYAVIATAGTLLLLLTPIYGALQLGAGVWAPRLVQVMPLGLLVGLGVVGVMTWGQARAPVIRIGTFAAAAALWLAIGYVAGRAVFDRVQHLRFAQTYIVGAGPLPNWRAVDAAVQAEPAPCVVLSDPWLSYVLTYYTGCSVVDIPAVHGSAYIDHLSRERAVRRVYSARTKMNDVIAALDAYQVNLVAVAMSRPWPQADDPRDLVNRLRRQPGFEDTGCCGDPVLIRYRGHDAR